MEQQTFNLQWQGITIEVTYTPLRWGVIDHLEIRSVKPERAPLPIMGTGYRSHFMQPGTIDAHGGDVVAQVRAWLDESALSSEWRGHIEQGRQGELFLRRRNVPKTPRRHGVHFPEIRKNFYTVPAQVKSGHFSSCKSVIYRSPI